MIKERLLALPGEIENKRSTLLAMQTHLRNEKEKLQMWELTELANISNELDENGKVKYSNDTKRKAELQHRVDISEEYAEIEKNKTKLEGKVDILNIQLETLLNEQGNLRAICRLEGGLND